MLDLSLTRDEAYEMMKAGHKVTHRFFSREEYLHMEGNKMYSEEGYRFEEGWAMREGDNWETGWYIWKEPKKNER